MPDGRAIIAAGLPLPDGMFRTTAHVNILHDRAAGAVQFWKGTISNRDLLFPASDDDVVEAWVRTKSEIKGRFALSKIEVRRAQGQHAILDFQMITESLFYPASLVQISESA